MLRQNVTNTLITNLFKTGLLLLQSVLLARILEPSSRGVFGILNYSVEFFTIIFSLNLGQTAAYFAARNHDDKGLVAFLLKNILVSWLLSFVFLLVGFVFFNGSFFVFPYGVFAETFFLFISINIILRLIYMSFADYFIAKGKVQWVNAIFLIHGIILCFSYALYYFVLKDSIKISYLFVIGITTVLAVFLAVIFLKQIFVDNNIKWHWTKANEEKKMFQYASTGYVEKVFNYLQDRSDYFMLLYFATATYYIGIYLLVLGIFNTIQKTITDVGKVFFLHLNKTQNPEISIRFFVKILALGMAFILVVLYFLAKPIVITLFGFRFIESYPVLVLLLPAIFFFGLKQLYSLYFASLNKQSINLMISIVVFVISIGLYYLFIPEKGIYGAALSYSISQSFATAIYIIVFLFTTKSSVKHFFYFDKDEMLLIRNFIQNIYLKFNKR